MKGASGWRVVRLAALLLAAAGFAAPPPPVARPVAGEVSGKGPGPAPLVTLAATPQRAAALHLAAPASRLAVACQAPDAGDRASPRHYLRHRAWLL